MNERFTGIAKLVKTKRVNHPNDYSQGRLSQALGYKNGQFISNVERGLCSVPLKKLPILCKTLDIDEESLKQVLIDDHIANISRHLHSPQSVRTA